ncbi:MAG TPA: META domain-containing protein [Terracidiphilus sp.]
MGRLAIILAAFAFAGRAQTPSPNAVSDLGGTSWRLVAFLSGDGTALTPEDQSKYTLAFEPAGAVSVRIDCNRGHGTWTSAAANQLQFGPLALTRAMCPAAAMNDRLVKDWQYVRSYTLKDHHLFLSLMADGGTYEYEPNAGPAAGPAPAASPDPAQPSALSSLPATFVGTLPCADCPGIRYQLNLNADHTFTSRMTYEERNTSFDESGRWELSDDGKTVVLTNGRGSKEKFALRVVETLRQLDSAGNEINSKFNYELERAPAFAPLESGGPATATLENTSWKLAGLGSSSVSAPSPQREAYFLLDPANHRISGSGGCNRLRGSYELNGEHLKVGQMAGTMMACPVGMDTEQAFLKSLGQVTRWKITGQSLELFDSDGNVLAEFKAGEN